MNMKKIQKVNWDFGSESRRGTCGTHWEVPGAVLGTYFLKKINRYPSTNK
jgi:hypothetical protein